MLTIEPTNPNTLGSKQIHLYKQHGTGKGTLQSDVTFITPRGTHQVLYCAHVLPPEKIKKMPLLACTVLTLNVSRHVISLFYKPNPVNYQSVELFCQNF